MILTLTSILALPLPLTPLGSGFGVPAGEQAKVGLAPEQGVAQVEEEGEEEEACGGPLVRVRVKVKVTGRLGIGAGLGIGGRGEG